MFPTWSDWDIRYTPKGLAKRRTKKLLRILMITLAIIAIRRASKRGLGMRDVPVLVKGYVRWGLLVGAGALQRVAGMV